MWRFISICVMTLWTISGFAQTKDTFKDAVRESVNYQLERYPKSTLKDIYKIFFQDRFGPGHIIRDTAAVRNYLQRELEITTDNAQNAVEPIGWQHNFYRVSLSAVKRNLISSEALLDAFIRSANETKSVSIDEWKREWADIESVIREMNLALPDYEKELAEIAAQLDKGIYMGHHSKLFNDEYAPHYRIIRKEIFENELQQKLK